MKTIRFHLSCKRRNLIYLKALAYFVQKMTNISLQFSFHRLQNQLCLLCSCDKSKISTWTIQQQLFLFNFNLFLPCLSCNLFVLTPRKCCQALFAVSFRCHQKSNYTCFKNTVERKFQMEFRPTHLVFSTTKTIKSVPCKHFKTVSFSMRFRGHETASISNRVRVNGA